MLTLTPFYPVAGDDAQGCFVAEPLAWLAKLGVTNTVRVARPFTGAEPGPATRRSPHDLCVIFRFPVDGGCPVRELFFLPDSYLKSVACMSCDRYGLFMPIPHCPAGTLLHCSAANSKYLCGHCPRPGCFFYPASWRLRRRVVRPRFAICVSHRALSDLCEREGPEPGNRRCRKSGKHDRFVQRGRPTNVFSSNGEPEATILSVGNLIPVKGHELLLRAFAAIQNQFPGTIARNFGDGPAANAFAATRRMKKGDRKQS